MLLLTDIVTYSIVVKCFIYKTAPALVVPELESYNSYQSFEG